MTFTMFGHRFVLISSVQHVADIMEKKSAIYSSRMPFPVAGDMVGWSEALILMSYGERMRETRKLISQVIGTPKRMEQFHPLIENEVRRFLVGLAGRTDTLKEETRQYVLCLFSIACESHSLTYWVVNRQVSGVDYCQNRVRLRV